MKTQMQNRLVGQGAKDAVAAAAKSAVKSAGSFSKWKGIEMAIIRSAFQNMIQMSIFEQAKTVIDDMEFSNGSKTLPEIKRELGRDQKVKKNDKL
jgi:Mitochondrial carrier protein